MDEQATDVDTLLPFASSKLSRVDLREVHTKYIIRQNSEKDLDRLHFRLRCMRLSHAWWEGQAGFESAFEDGQEKGGSQVQRTSETDGDIQ